MGKLRDKNIRRIVRHGGSYGLTIPIEIMEKLGWKEKQKVVIEMKGRKIEVSDWK